MLHNLRLKSIFYTGKSKKHFSIGLQQKSAKAKKCIDIYYFFSIFPLQTANELAKGRGC